MKTKILLLRHAETEKNKEGKLLGHADSELTPKGIKQAGLVGEYLKKFNIAAMYCSDLGRADKTAQIIGEKIGLKPIGNDGLRENNFGVWKDLRFTEFIEKMDKLKKEMKAKGLKDEDIRPPEGENTYDHEDRVMKAIHKIINVHKGKTIVIIAHAGTNKVALGAMRNLVIDQYYDTPQDNCCINIIEFDNKTNMFTVLDINNTAHLKDL